LFLKQAFWIHFDMAPQAEQALEGPAFVRISPWVQQKLSPLAVEKIQAVHEWVEQECIPREPIVRAQLEGRRWTTPPVIHELRKKAKERGLFNLFLPNHFAESPGLTNLEYSCCAEIMGRCYWAAQVCTSTQMSIYISKTPTYTSM
jgi:acyl-CoA dehydrogenase